MFPENYPVYCYFMCIPLLFMKGVLSPKSIKYITSESFFPIIRLSGLMSPWTNPNECKFFNRSNYKYKVNILEEKYDLEYDIYRFYFSNLLAFYFKKFSQINA